MRPKHTLGLALIALGIVATIAPSAHALAFNNTINNTTGNAAFNTAVTQAEALWQGVFRDGATLNLTFNFNSSVSGLASTSSTLSAQSYSSYRSSLLGDSTTATDTAALSSLPATASLSFTTRKAGATVLDNNGTANNNFLAITNANAKAAGIAVAAGNDATVNTSSTAVAYDFNRADGIDPNQYDIVGILAHEIGHAMGFVSFADNLDVGGNSDDAVAELRPLDLFRRKSSGGGIDVTTAGDPYLSLDNGATRVGNLSSGQFQGDLFQASHWENRGPGSANAGPVIGIMDPQIANGELASITSADIAAFDAIGWTVQVPEPTTLAALAAGTLALAARRRRA